MGGCSERWWCLGKLPSGPAQLTRAERFLGGQLQALNGNARPVDGLARLGEALGVC